LLALSKKRAGIFLVIKPSVECSHLAISEKCPGTTIRGFLSISRSNADHCSLSVIPTRLPRHQRYAISRQRFLRNPERHRLGFRNSRPNGPVVLPLLIQLLHHLRCQRPKVARHHDLNRLPPQVQPRRTVQHRNHDTFRSVATRANLRSTPSHAPRHPPSPAHPTSPPTSSDRTIAGNENARLRLGMVGTHARCGFRSLVYVQFEHAMCRNSFNSLGDEQC
jgi:hypothetical protein